MSPRNVSLSKNELLIVAAFVLGPGFFADSSAAPVLDQENPNSIPHLLCGDSPAFLGFRCEWQQAVTAGLTGQLTGVRLYSTGTAQVRIGLGSPFYSGPWAADIIAAPIDGTIIDLTPYNIVMAAGSTFVIDVMASPSDIDYPIGGTSTPPQYSGGDLWFTFLPGTPLNHTALGGQQLAFQTFVDQPRQTPEPATLLLFGVGFAGIGLSRRRSAAYHQPVL